MMNSTGKCLFITTAFLFLAVSGCSVKHTALNAVGDALSSGGTVFTADNDPELIRDALPFALKMYESVLDGAPEHTGLLLATARAFTLYAYAFVQMEAERIDEKDYERAKHLRYRASLLYLRARDYALRGLEFNHPGFHSLIRSDHESALRLTEREDAPLLYWCGVSWVAALSAEKDNIQLIIEMPLGAAMVRRVLELDEGFDSGAAHDFFIAYDGGRAEAMGGSEQSAREHFRRSVELSRGEKAGPYVSFAENVSISKQRREEFVSLLEAALSIEANKYPENRLANLIMQEKARWLLSRINEYFLEESEEDK